MRPAHRARRSLLAAAGSALLVAGLLPAGSVLAATELYFSEYIEGSSNNKALEIYNGTGADMNLAQAGYSVQMFFNGNTTAGLTIAMTGSVPAGGVYVLAHAQANAGILAAADQTNGSGWFNGDDAIVLRHGTTIVDSIGQVGVDPGTQWGTGDLSTADNTLRRKAAVDAGDINATDAFDPAAEWDGFANDTANGLGARTGDGAAPAVTGTTPAHGGKHAPSSNLTVTFSEPVRLTDSSVTIDCTVTGAHPATVSGSGIAWTVDPATDFDENESCTATVLAAGVADVDADDPPDNLVADYTWTFALENVCVLPYTRIPVIQGTDDTADVTGPVATRGIVVGDYEESGELRGFYIQDREGDGNAATSDGVFVFNAGRQEVILGDDVFVRGTAGEFQGQTQVSASTVVDCGDATVAPTDVTLPFDSLAEREQYEGMLIRLAQTVVVNEHFQLGRFGQIVVGSERHYSPTLVAEPGDEAREEIAWQALDSLIIDDQLQIQNPDPILFGRGGDELTSDNTLRIGDTATNVVGLMTYTWAGNGASPNAYRLRPVDALGGSVPDFEARNTRPTNPDAIGGDLRVAAFNVLNYFTTIDEGPDVCGPSATLDCRGADSLLEFERQEAKIVAALTGLDADIVAINELENNERESLAALVAALDKADGAGTWAYIDTGTIGTDAIKVGLIYKPGSVTPVGDHAILDSSVDPRFDDTRSRPALAQTFDRVGGGRLTVVANHLKSKGSACTGDPDLGDGAGHCNITRTLAAEALVDWIADDPTDSGDRDVLVIGDLNSYAKEDPIDVFIDAGYTNLVEEFIGDAAYSYVFGASSGYLDHALASPTLLAQVAGATEWHINADEPPVLDYNIEFKSADQVADLHAPDPYRSSDHDPVVVGLDLLNYAFDGFRVPVMNPPRVNRAIAGASVPVKFDLADGLALDVLFGTPTTRQLTCGPLASQGAPAATSSVGGLGLQQDSVTRQYTYEWKTLKGWAGQCRDIELTFDDGSYRRAYFSFR